MRIVSLLPSATEIICALGLLDQLVGVTHECDYPPPVLGLPHVTRTLIPQDVSSSAIDTLVRDKMQLVRALYTLDLATLEALHPDLIVTQTLCDVCAVAEDEVRAAATTLPGRPRVVNLEPQTFAEVLESFRQVGTAAACSSHADAVVQGLQARVQAVASRFTSLQERPRVVVWSGSIHLIRVGTGRRNWSGLPAARKGWDRKANGHAGSSGSRYAIGIRKPCSLPAVASA